MRLTLRLFNLLVRRFNKEKEDKQYSNAAIIAAIENTTATKQSEMKTPEDILGKKTKKKDLDTKMYNAFATLKAMKNG